MALICSDRDRLASCKKSAEPNDRDAPMRYPVTDPPVISKRGSMRLPELKMYYARCCSTAARLTGERHGNGHRFKLKRQISNKHLFSLVRIACSSHIFQTKLRM